MVIPFGFRVQEAVAAVFRYTNLVFAVFVRGYLLALLGSSAGVGTDNDMVALGEAR